MRRLLGLIWLNALCAGAGAWNSHGHRTVTLLAMEEFALTPDAPAWLLTPALRERVAYQASEADRWRSTRMNALGNENNPDHYLDVDTLEEFGLTLESMPPLRSQYLAALAIAKYSHPENVAAYDASKDPENSKEWPGFVAHAIVEHYAKLRASFTNLRILEAVADPARAEQIEMARANVAYHMGLLSHFVGDAAQPLHTTKHHHGWVGDNPHGYTTEYRFHAYIDGEVLELHGLGFLTLKDLPRPARTVNGADPWSDALAHIERSFVTVETLYQLEKSGDLTGEAGKAFISERLCDGGAMLGALYRAAWVSSEPTDEQLAAFMRFEKMRPDLEK